MHAPHGAKENSASCLTPGREVFFFRCVYSPASFADTAVIYRLCGRLIFWLGGPVSSRRFEITP